MRELLAEIAEWREPFALATVVETWSSAPRPAGAALALDAAGTIVGSVSVGCIEADLYERCQTALRTGETDLVRYGVSDDEAFAVGMTCGGEIEVFIERVDPEELDLTWLNEQVIHQRPAALATVIDGPDAGTHVLLSEGNPFGPPLPGESFEPVHTALAVASRDDLATIVEIPAGEGGVARVLVEPFLPAPRLLIFGGVDFAASLASMGKLLGYYVVVCDARPIFATQARFPDADEVVVAWPHDYLARAHTDEHTAVCVLTHDSKFDEPLLELAVTLPLGYIGAMGSRRTHDERFARLRTLGLTESQLGRIRSPIGLDLGGRTPAETAVSIIAEIVAARWGGSGEGLSNRSGVIHPRQSGTTSSILLSELAAAGTVCATG